jgi:uncharacterized protein YkwD
MKSLFLGTFCVLATILGITATATADVSINMPTESSDLPNSETEINKSTQPSPQAATQPPVGIGKLEAVIFDRINKYRQSKNLPPLAFDPIVAATAKAHSEDMARKSILSHDGFHERFESVSEAMSVQSAAENVATNRGYNDPEIVAIQSWLDSPGHHHNIVGRYDTTGIGIVQNAKGEYYFTQLFVRKGRG